MRESAYIFLRATFFRWMQLWPERCPKLDEAPEVVGVGDLHLENFGTWRDEDNRLVWGVNDVDEACEIPYTLDLVRLAVPRRVYTNTHLEYVAEVTAGLKADPAALRGVRIVKQAPLLRHFTARFELM